MLKEKHKDLPFFKKQVKLLYINELMEKDEIFEAEVTDALRCALKRSPNLSTLVTFEDLDENARLDIVNPIEQSK
jgi:hypothetical protein